ALKPDKPPPMITTSYFISIAIFLVSFSHNCYLLFSQGMAGAFHLLSIINHPVPSHPPQRHDIS
ncbi:MAG: hypothetical protein KKD63_07195, partial [Proteobacteria bacterium]|nr:hypothetical protein [Pseudomonadota bacterium]